MTLPERKKPVIIQPDAWYDDRLFFDLDIRPAVLKEARRSGQLRFVRKGNTTLYRGAWVLAWLDPSAEPVGKGGAP